MPRTLESPPRDELELQQLARKVAVASGAKRVILFGSIARGEAKSDSDTDLLLVFDDDLKVDEITERLIAADTATLPRWFALDLVPMLESDYLEHRSILSDTVHREGRTLYVR